ncbi:hypothetical protein LguiB_021046 [Lonicera macranthoides]
MNGDKKRWRNRVGLVDMPYTLLYPSSEVGLTGKGIPNTNFDLHYAKGLQHNYLVKCYLGDNDKSSLEKEFSCTDIRKDLSCTKEVRSESSGRAREELLSISTIEAMHSVVDQTDLNTSLPANFSEPDQN